MALADPTSILLVFSGLISLAWMRIGMVRAGRREQALPVFIFYALFSAGWAALAVLLRLSEMGFVHGFDSFALARFALYFLLGQAVCFRQLTRQFSRQPVSSTRYWAAALLFFGAAVLLYENPLHLPVFLPVNAGYGISLYQAGFAVILLGWSVFQGGSILLTLRSIRHERVPLHRNRSQYWGIAVVLETLAHVLMFSRQSFAGGVLHILAGTLVAVVLRTYALPDLRQVTRRAVTYLATTLVSAALYGLLYLALHSAVRAEFISLPVVLLLFLLAGALFSPLLTTTQRFLQRSIMGERYDARQTVSRYSQSISNILDLDRLASSVVEQVRAVFDCTHGALIVVHRGLYAPEQRAYATYDLLPFTGDGEAQNVLHLATRSPVISAWQNDNLPLTQYDMDVLPRFQGMDAAERAALSALRMDVFVPVFAKHQWIGLLALGPRRSGERYYADDLSLLQTLADQTAVALENARLYADLMLRNQENERLNIDLQEANSELARLDQAKADFISIASHELRTPLTQVIGYNDILTEWLDGNQLQPDSARGMLQAVRRAARRLEEIVDTMFDVSRIEARVLELSCAWISPEQVIEEAVEAWSAGIKDRGLSVTCQGIDDLPALVGDHRRLVQVFRQLIQNAIKSTPNGGRILLSGAVLEPQQDPDTQGLVEIVVEDTGIGIAPEELERIFVKFYRVGNVLLHSSGDTKFKGAGPGLGLTIARGIVEAHGGKIWAESPGFDETALPGAKFHVLLPIHNPALDQYL